MAYKLRITDDELKRKLKASCAVLIRGPYICGKTEPVKTYKASGTL